MPADTLYYSAASAPSFFSLILRLLLLLVFMGGGLYALRWLKARRPATLQDERPMEVLSAVSLGARRQAVLLRVSGKVFLLGLGEGGVRPLGRFSGEEADELIARAGQGPNPFHLRFMEAFRKGESTQSVQGEARP